MFPPPNRAGFLGRTPPHIDLTPAFHYVVMPS